MTAHRLGMRVGPVKTQRNEGRAGVKNWSELREVREGLFRKTRDLLLFDLVTQTNARLDTLLKLRVKDLRNLRVGDEVRLFGKGGRTENVFAMTETIAETLGTYLNKSKLRNGDYLFKSRKGSRPLTLSSVSSMVKHWFRTATAGGVSGVKSLRRSWLMSNQGKAQGGESGVVAGDPHGTLRPAKKETLQEVVHAELLHSIATSQIPPGTRLLTEKIAQQMNVSPMPVREALGKLEAVGFVRSQQKRGYIVNELSKESLREIIKIRLLLESMAVEIAAVRRSDETIRHLNEIQVQHQKATKMRDVDEILHWNREFHHMIYRCANMPILQQMIEGLWTRMSPYLYIHTREGQGFDLDKFPNHHAHMIEALKCKDPTEASKWLRTDLNVAFNELMGVFDRVGIG